MRRADSLVGNRNDKSRLDVVLLYIHVWLELQLFQIRFRWMAQYLCVFVVRFIVNAGVTIGNEW